MSNLTDLLPAGGGGKNVDFVASGTLASGQTVALKTNGQVEAVTGVTQGLGAESVYESANSNYTTATYDSINNKVVIVYQDTGNSNYGTAVVGTVSGTNISFGTPVVYESGAVQYMSPTYDSSAEKVVIAYTDTNNSYYGTAIVGTVSGTSISFGSPVVFETASSYYVTATFDSTGKKIVIAYRDDGNSSYGTAIVGTVSGTSISFGGAAVFESAATVLSFGGATYDSTNQKIVIAYRDSGNSNYGTAVVGTVSGTSISFGTPVVFEAANTSAAASVFDPNSNKIIIAYSDAGNSYYGTAIVGTVSGTSISFGTAVVFAEVNTDTFSGVTFDSTANKIVIVYSNSSGSNHGKVLSGAVSGTSIIFDAEIVFNAAATYYCAATYDSTNNKAVIAYRDAGNSNYGTAAVFTVGSTNNTDFIGITDAAIANTASGSVTIKGGVITNTNLNVAAAITAGSKVVFDDAGPTTGIALAYDPDTAKVVNVFCTTNVQGIVGTVSGTSISYGSAASANSNSSSDSQVAYDTVNNKIVAVYKEGFNDARVVIGTVSGTAISWGTPVVFASVNAATPNVAFDTNAGKVLIVYKDQADNNKGKAVVGTVSGTSISIGSPVTFINANANKIEIVYDANAQKSVLVVQDSSNSIGVAYVATISGTSVSFGSPTNFLSSALTANALAITYNSTDNKVIVGYSKGSDNKGYLTTGTVSGTSISFAGETEFSGSATTNYISLAYKTSGNILGMAYNISSGTVKFNAAVISGTSFSFGTEQELTAAATDTTAIVEDSASGNFVASYGDGSNNSDGTTNVLSVATTLVTGTDYYVQSDGTLSTTTSSVLAGKALSATSINLDYTT